MIKTDKQTSPDLYKDQQIFIKSLPNILGFIISILSAYYLNFQTIDVVWSLWISSLLFGYVVFFAYSITLFIKTKDAKKSLIMLVFFSFHFMIFHLVHANVLSEFFPLSFDIDNINPLKDFNVGIFTTLYENFIKPYAWFIFAIIIAEKDAIFKPFLTQNTDKNFMFYPYKNVIKMHIMLFVFALAFKLEIDNFALLVVVYFVYFLPWNDIKKLVVFYKNKSKLKKLS
jgi:hypothetical protein